MEESAAFLSTILPKAEPSEERVVGPIMSYNGKGLTIFGLTLLMIQKKPRISTLS